MCGQTDWQQCLQRQKRVNSNSATRAQKQMPHAVPYFISKDPDKLPQHSLLSGGSDITRMTELVGSQEYRRCSGMEKLKLVHNQTVVTKVGHSIWSSWKSKLVCFAVTGQGLMKTILGIKPTMTATGGTALNNIACTDTEAHKQFGKSFQKPSCKHENSSETRALEHGCLLTWLHRQLHLAQSKLLPGMLRRLQRVQIYYT